jgi:Rrf2 family transcriptional regulator, iron-sulfur cluster assembly transcription factor
MRLSTKGRFAVTAMIDIALREHLGPVSLAAISTRHQMSLSYLEQLFARMRTSGLVDSTRGPGGGYSLARRPEQITVADIIGAVETRVDDVDEDDDTRAHPACLATQDLWHNLSGRMRDYMQTITLRGLADAERAKGVKVEAPVAKRGVFARPKADVVRPAVPNSVFALAGGSVKR